jgi:hypothetical protein
MRTTAWLATVAWAAVLLIGCPSSDDDDDTTAEEPVGCESFSLQNIQYEFEVEDPDDLLGTGLTVTDDAYWLDLAEEVAASSGYHVLMLAWPLTVAAHEPDGNRWRLDMEFRDKDGLALITVHFWYFLPQGKTIPVAAEEDVQWAYVFNLVSQPATAPLVFDADGVLLFYGEPGANGITFSNDPIYPDETENPLFSNVIPQDRDCSPLNYLDCGNQYNLELEFLTWSGETILLWPGETGTFLFGEEDAQREYELTNVWSYDWRDVTCDGPQYERNYAFFLLVNN